MMFIFIVGNVEQTVFRLGTASNPDTYLSSVQKGNPYALSVLSKICVRNKNEATLVESLGRRELKGYEEAGGWILNVPAGLVAQLISDRYLRSLASKADVAVIERRQTSTPMDSMDLRRLTPSAKQRELTFKDVLASVDRAYSEGVCIDELI